MSASVPPDVIAYAAPHIRADTAVAIRHDTPIAAAVKSQATIASDSAVIAGRL
jgi:hypothetical protein